MKKSIGIAKNLVLIAAMIFVPASASAHEELTVEDWHTHRAKTLVESQKILTNGIFVNAEQVRELKDQMNDYAINELPSVQRILKHPSLSSMVVLSTNGDVLLEHHRADRGLGTVYSVQSSTKLMGHVLIQKMLKDGKIKLSDLISDYVPGVSGYKDRTVNDLAAMLIDHTSAELAAYKGDPDALAFYELEDKVYAQALNPTRAIFQTLLKKIKPAGKDGSTEFKGDVVNYASSNTNTIALIAQAVYKRPAQSLVREIMHAIKGENTVYMATDYEGFPIIGGGLVASSRDFARLGLLVADKSAEQFEKELIEAQELGGNVPADVASVDSKYYRSAMWNEFGLGHSGWGGSLLWTDPVSGTVVAVITQVNSEFPAPYDHYNKMYSAAIEIVKYQRAKQEEQ